LPTGFAADWLSDQCKDMFKALDLPLCLIAVVKKSSLAVVRLGRTCQLGQSLQNLLVRVINVFERVERPQS
jgi:hypothetical protein